MWNKVNSSWTTISQQKLGAVEPQARGIVEAQAQKGSEMENNLKLRATAGNLGTQKFNVTSNKFSCLEAL
ncbi:hypothetical protein FRX31_014601 [Thalictrum thalictroides]|uniref:Uncharacterized protein n=1 Tax=Thalictrum thalictroides TaxID=46969 RepID=A0A7J6WI90_THATH|nr:hypothetical protein FRX31_014601 [Thalictrum thalictroides]